MEFNPRSYKNRYLFRNVIRRNPYTPYQNTKPSLTKTINGAELPKDQPKTKRMFSWNKYIKGKKDQPKNQCNAYSKEEIKNPFNEKKTYDNLDNFYKEHDLISKEPKTDCSKFPFKNSSAFAYDIKHDKIITTSNDKDEKEDREEEKHHKNLSTYAKMQLTKNGHRFFNPTTTDTYQLNDQPVYNFTILKKNHSEDDKLNCYWKNPILKYNTSPKENYSFKTNVENNPIHRWYEESPINHYSNMNLSKASKFVDNVDSIPYKFE